MTDFIFSQGAPHIAWARPDDVHVNLATGAVYLKIVSTVEGEEETGQWILLPIKFTVVPVSGDDTGIPPGDGDTDDGIPDEGGN